MDTYQPQSPTYVPDDEGLSYDPETSPDIRYDELPAQTRGQLAILKRDPEFLHFVTQSASFQAPPAERKRRVNVLPFYEEHYQSQLQPGSLPYTSVHRSLDIVFQWAKDHLIRDASCRPDGSGYDPVSVLDLGCGIETGLPVSPFVSRYTGIDASSAAILACQTQANYIAADLRYPVYPRKQCLEPCSFDVVTCYNMLQHFMEAPDTIRMLFATIKHYLNRYNALAQVHGYVLDGDRVVELIRAKTANLGRWQRRMCQKTNMMILSHPQLAMRFRPSDYDAIMSTGAVPDYGMRFDMCFMAKNSGTRDKHKPYYKWHPCFIVSKASLEGTAAEFGFMLRVWASMHTFIWAKSDASISPQCIPASGSPKQLDELWDVLDLFTVFRFIPLIP